MESESLYELWETLVNYIPGKDRVEAGEMFIKQCDDLGMSIEDMASHHKVDVDNIIDALEKGVNVELEHTTEMMVAFEIAMDHIYEDLNYYNNLEKIESKEATTSSSVGAYDAPFGGPKKAHYK